VQPASATEQLAFVEMAEQSGHVVDVFEMQRKGEPHHLQPLADCKQVDWLTIVVQSGHAVAFEMHLYPHHVQPTTERAQFVAERIAEQLAHEAVELIQV
jgi:hypothetical protein